MLRWRIAEKDIDPNAEDGFVIEANGSSLSAYEYLSPSFKLIDEDPAYFDAKVRINNEHVCTAHTGGSFVQFEWSTSRLTHMITETVDDQEVKEIKMRLIKHGT